MRVAVLTISDTVARGLGEDLSGPAIVSMCRGLGWELIATEIISDELPGIQESLRSKADSGRLDIILTVGGTGIGPRDNTPEATQNIADRVVPGVAEEIRRVGLTHTPMAVLSRGVCAVRAKTLIINLPGSPKGATQSLEAIVHLLPHAVKVLNGARHD
jgi:molybdenum cofactor synthesis domain-containing protein